MDGNNSNDATDNLVPAHQHCHWDWHLAPYEVEPFNMEDEDDWPDPDLYKRYMRKRKSAP